MAGESKGFEMIDTDQQRSKFTNEQWEDFEQWIESHCKLVIANPLKNDMVSKRDPSGEY